MRSAALVAACGLLLGLATFASGRMEATCRLTVRLVDAQTGTPRPGLFRVLDRNGEPLKLQALPDEQGTVSGPLSRGLGLAHQPAIGSWSVIMGDVTVTVPAQAVVLEAFSGLETELARLPLELSGRSAAEARVPLTRFYSAAGAGYRGANTHLHLMKLSRADSDRYLREVPRADGLDLLFVSYLERAEADREYVSNQYTREDLERLSAGTGVVFGHGEEHRHNFTAQGQGFGHVMLLDIPRLIHPVSIGPGITKTGTDGLPLQRGIDQARQDGAAAIWCHNNWGLERLPNLITGRIDAQNIFDGGTHGSYKDSFYRCLNAGLKTPFSTGTDWFQYDFSRTYVQMEGSVTTGAWLKALAAGRSYITNGTFLELQAAGEQPGGTVRLERAGQVAVAARGIGRADFHRIELLQNGRVIQTQASHPVGGHYEAELRLKLSVDSPCWLALRLPPPPVKDDPELSQAVPFNEYGQPLFAHTSAVDVEVGGRRHFDGDVARSLLREMQDHLRALEQQAQFADAAERARVADVYLDAIAAFERRLAAAAR